MYRIGVDVGGTGIQVGVIDENLKILSEGSIPTQTTISFSEQVEKIVSCVIETSESAGLSRDKIESVGVGIPGIANQNTGEIIKCTNMGWNHVPFRDEFKKHLNVPVFIDNDANVAALAESVAGISAGTSSSVFITIGTGIGSGIIINGKIWNGFHGVGGEFGHTILSLNGVPCTCGNKGCLERYTSATALIRMAKEAVSSNPDTQILRMVSGDISRIKARTVIDAARDGDPLASEVYNLYIDQLAQAISNIVNFIDPEVIVIGGGVSNAGDFLLEPLRKKYRDYVVYKDQPIPEIKLAVLGAKAGIIGAAMLS